MDRLGFRVTVNPDNIDECDHLDREFALLAEAFDYSLEDAAGSSIAAKSVFAPYGVRKALVARIAAADRIGRCTGSCAFDSYLGQRTSFLMGGALNWEQIWEQRVR